MEIIYCDKWSMTKKKSWNIIDRVKAQQNHINKVPYSVLIQENNEVKNIIEITDKYVSVNFMNKFISPYLCYVFTIKDNNNIFLTTAYHFYYDERSNDKLVDMTFSFAENGNIIMERRDYKTDEIEGREFQKNACSNWDKFPEFGKYKYLLREER